jgi:putative transposase
VAAKAYGGRSWAKEALEVPVNQKTRGRLVVFGAYNPHRDELILTCKERGRHRQFLEFLEELEARLEGRLYLIMDNSTIHKAKRVLKLFEEGKRLVPIWLPTYSPHLNPIEPRWKNLQAEAINNRSFSSVSELEEAIKAYEGYYNAQRKTIM